MAARARDVRDFFERLAIQNAALPWPEHFECRDKEEHAKEHA